MKRFALVVFGALVFAAPVLAAPVGRPIVKTHVPFSFHVGEVALPPGNYVIEQVSDLDANLLEIRSWDSRHTVMFMAQDGDRQDLGSALEFDRVGSETFLRAVWSDGRGALLPKSPAETAETADVQVSATSTPDPSPVSTVPSPDAAATK